MPPETFKYIASLTSAPLKVSDFREFKIDEISLFWTDLAGGRMSDTRTGILFCRGTFTECIKKACQIIDAHGIESVKEIMNRYPGWQELYDFRRELLRLHINWRRLTRKKLKTELRKDRWCGDLFVPEFPDCENARQRKIINRIKEMQERKLYEGRIYCQRSHGSVEQ